MYLLDINPLSVNVFANTFFQSTFFTFLMGSSGGQKFWQLKFLNHVSMHSICLKKKVFPYPQDSSDVYYSSCSLTVETKVTIFGATCPPTAEVTTD